MIRLKGFTLHSFLIVIFFFLTMSFAAHSAPPNYPTVIPLTEKAGKTGASPGPVLNGVAYGDNTFLAVGENVFTSTDGVTWKDVPSYWSNVAPLPLKGVEYGGLSIFTAVTGHGIIAYDGTTWWEPRHLIFNAADIFWGIGCGMVVGYELNQSGPPNGVIYGYSLDDSVPPSPAEMSFSDAIFYGASCGENTTVIVGGIGSIVLKVWDDPYHQTYSWKNVSVDPVKVGDFYAVTYADNTFVAVGYNDSAYPVNAVIITSPDGTTWTKRTSGETGYLYSVGYGNNTFVAVGEDGKILTSPDGATWTKRTSGTTNSINGVTYGNNTFVAVGDNCTILTSPDGITWTATTAISVTLTVNRSGEGSGAVVSNPVGINCSTNCSSYFSQGTTVTLTVTPATGTTFTGWTGCDSSSGNTCTVTMTNAKSVCINFTVSTYTLTTTATGNGSGALTATGLKCTGTSCSGTYVYNTTVRITATPASGSAFAGWTGCDASLGTTCTVIMAANKSVTANFTNDTYVLTTTATGTGSGTLSAPGLKCTGTSCSGTYLYNTMVNITATATGSTLTGWTGCDSSSGNTCTVTMTSGKSVSANFTINSYTLTVTEVQGGSGTLTATGLNCIGKNCSGTYLYGTTVYITETANTGSTFTGWFGCDSYIHYSAEPTALSKMDFKTQGLVAKNRVAKGENITCVVVMTADKSVVVGFQINTYTLTATATGTGSGTLSASGLNCTGTSCSGTYVYNTTINITASASTGSTVTGWTGCDSSSGNICTVTMTSGKAVSANFTLNTYTLMATATGNGAGTLSAPGFNCSGNTCTGIYNYNTPLHITATANTGSTFTGWTGCDSSLGNICTVTMTSGKAVSANFTLNSYMLTTTATGTGSGTLAPGLKCTGTGCSGTYLYNTTVNITATPATGSATTGWTGCDSSSGNTCTVTVTGNKSVTANFSLNTYTVSASASGGHGSVQPSTQKVNYGSQASIAVTPNAGYHIASIMDNGQSVTISNPYVINDVTADHVVVVAFGATYALTVQHAGEGTGSINSNPSGINCGSTCSHSYLRGTTVALTAIAGGHSTFTGWSGGGCSGKGVCHVTMKSDTNVTATFAPPVSLTVQPGGDGTGTVTSSPAGLNCGATCTAGFKLNSQVILTAHPAAGSYFTGWGGSCTGNKLTCTVTMAQATTVNAGFSIDPRISVTPASRNFVNVPSHQTRSQVFTLTNTGKSTLSLTTLSITGSPSFTLNSGHCNNANMGPNKACTFTVTFKPLDTTSANATVSIPSNDPVTPVFTLPLSGNTGATEEAGENEGVSDE